MEEFLEQIIKRWETAFDEMDRMADFRSKVKTWQYADSYRYDLKNFNRSGFPPGGPILADKPAEEYLYDHEYGMDADGRPCYTSLKNSYDKMLWEGCYFYSDNLVEYIEYCMDTKVPSCIQRIEYMDNKKMVYQNLVINSRASGPGYTGMSKAQIIEETRNDKYVFIIQAEQYEYESDRIREARGIAVAPGIGQYLYQKAYTYDLSGLDEIRTFYNNGKSQLSYCRIPEDADPAALLDQLTETMAQSIIGALLGRQVEEPMALLQLSYHYADRYEPILTWKSEAYKKSVLEKNNKEIVYESLFLSNFEDHIIVDTKPFERLFQQFLQIIDENDDPGIGRTMLQKTAALLTRNKMYGRISVSEDFAAYAIDGSIEGHSDEEFEEILMACGVDAGVIGEWKEKGML